MKVKRGDIYFADLRDDRIDSVCRIRPVLIVQNNKGNAHSTSYVAALITSKPKKHLPTHFVLGRRCGLKKKSTVLCEHLVTVRQEMLMSYIGTIAKTADEKKLDKALLVSLQL